MLRIDVVSNRCTTLDLCLADGTTHPASMMETIQGTGQAPIKPVHVRNSVQLHPPRLALTSLSELGNLGLRQLLVVGLAAARACIAVTTRAKREKRFIEDIMMLGGLVRRRIFADVAQRIPTSS